MVLGTILLRCMVSSQSHAYGYLVLLRLRRLFSVSHLWLSQRYGAATVSHHDLALLATWYCYGEYSYSHAYRCLFTISHPWLYQQVGAATVSLLNLTPMVSHTIWIRYGVFNVIPIGLYQQFGPSTVSSIPSPIQLTFGAAAVLSILSPIRLYHECGAATMSSPLSHSHLFFPTPSCGATNTPPLYSQSRSLWARPLNILMDSQERSLAN